MPRPATQAKYILALDQGTSSTRAIAFDRQGATSFSAQIELKQHYPKPGWVEHDALVIWDASMKVLETVISEAGGPANIAGLGITNQRETVVVWDRRTGSPLCNAIVWQDTRTQPIIERLTSDTAASKHVQLVTGLPPATYFSASKIGWILDNITGARASAEAGHLAFGTIDTWLVWQLTSGAKHLTDVTNASRTQLMNIKTLEWSEPLFELFDIPISMAPQIVPTSDAHAIATSSAAKGITIAGMIGDQQSAAFGQTMFDSGEIKTTFGTGNFLLAGTGRDVVRSDSGLLTTVAYQVGKGPANYALEGSIAASGAAVQWLRDNLGVVASTAEIEALASSVPDNGGVFVVPAFSGLLAPYWRPDAAGTIVGLSFHSTKAHIARATLESVAFQTDAIFTLMRSEADISAQIMRVDGGMTTNNLLMQFQADILGITVVRNAITETTALGAAYAAGLAINFWDSLEELREKYREGCRWAPSLDSSIQTKLRARWDDAVQRSLNWK